MRIPRGVEGDPVKSASWVVRTTHKGKTRKATVGRWPDMNPDRARRERDKILGIGSGLTVTVSEAIEDYRTLVTDKMKSGWQLEPYLKHFNDRYGKRKLATIGRPDLVALVKRYSKNRGSRSAARYLGTLKGIFDLAVEHGTLEFSPLLGVTKRVTGYKQVDRDRVLSDEEIKWVWKQAHKHSALLRFLLLTGLRISEAQKGHREGDRWIVPTRFSKNKKEHWVYLCPSAVDQLDMPFNTSATAVQAWLRRKLEKAGMDDESRWTPHDLRRTAVTRMNEAGVDPYIVERTIGHTLQGVMAAYNLAEYEQQRINAIDRLEESVLKIVR